MIQDGDHIAVGLSGGKDSLTLLTALRLYQNFSPEKFTLTAVMIDMGFSQTNIEEINSLKKYCENNDIHLIIEKTQIGEILFDIRKEKNPCSLCSKMRRGALNTKCKEIKANKLALGHHSEDVLETFLLSFMYEGRLSTFMPVSFMDRSEITLIRPLIYTNECDIKSAAKRLRLPVVHNPCPKNHVSQREYMKNLVKHICEDIPFAKDRMIAAILHPERSHLFPPKNE
jgi:tRNA(Ile)-lysidine synthetase-like protein